MEKEIKNGNAEMEVSQFGDLFPFPSLNPIEAIPFLKAQKLAELLQSSSTFDYFLN